MSSNVLYRFYSAAGELLYIGITNDAWRRFSQHRADKSWWPEVMTTCQQIFTTREELSAAESRAIKSENPRYNIKGNGVHHIEDAQVQPRSNGLVGKCFHSWEPMTDDNKSATVKDGRAVVWQGRIVSQVDSQRFLIELFSWWDGTPSGQRLISLDEMSSWTFYHNNIEMVAALGCTEKDCHYPPRFFAEYFSAVCSHHSADWSRIQEIIWEDGIAKLGDEISTRG